MTNYIVDYYNQLQCGKAVASKWVKKCYEIIINDLEKSKYFYNEKKAVKAVKFIEAFCHHSKGRSDLIKLELWQKALVSCIFGLVDSNGLRQYREIVVIIARKNGKSLLASAIIACCTYLDKEEGAEIYCLAPKLDQAKIVFDCFYQTITKEPELDEISEKRRSDIYIEKSNTTIKPLAFSDKRSDGLNPHLTVCDEIAAWRGQQGLRMYEVIVSALGSRLQPIVLSISTAGYENDSIYDELIARGTSFLNGSSQETQLLPIFYMIDDVEAWDSIEELKKANPNMGVSVQKSFFLEEIRKAKQSLSKKAEFMTKYCNIKQNSSQAWLTWELVEKACQKKFSLEDFRKCYAVAGIDLSQTTDLTAACIVIEKEGEEYVFVQFFMPRNRVKDLSELDKVPYEIFAQQGLLTLSGENYVDYHDVKAWYDSLRRDYQINIVKAGYDRYSAQYFVEEMSGSGYFMDDVVQGWNLAPIIREFEGKLKDGTIHIGQNNLLKAHLLNVALKYENDNQRFKPAKIRASDHIDGFVSIIDALTVKSKWYADIKFLITNRR